MAWSLFQFTKAPRRFHSPPDHLINPQHKRSVNPTTPETQCFIIAEAGVNHNGRLELALKLVDKAAEAGANAVKFQTFTASKLVRAGTRTANYQEKNAGQTDQQAMLRELEMTPEMHEQIVERCRVRRIEFMSTPFDAESADMLLGLGMQCLKIPSGEVTNLPFLARVARLDVPLILSTGMATIEEVEEAVGVIQSTRARPGGSVRLTLLHCTSNYPTALEDVNLRAMQTLRERFGLPVGYSDHTAGILIPVAAVAMGATVIEKHFTLDRQLPGPDHLASLEPVELQEMVTQIRALERSFGDGQKRPREKELPVRDLVRRSLVAARDIRSGEVLTEGDVVMLRPGTGLAPRELSRVVGRRACVDIAANTQLTWEHLT